LRILRRKFSGVSRSDKFTIVPLGDLHVGAKACDEALLRKVIRRIAADPMCYWAGMGDYGEYINTSDPRFDPLALADWIGMDDLVDLAAAQSEYLRGLLNPILGKCLGLLEGNHELRIKRVYERDVYRDLVLAVKAAAGMGPKEQVGMGAAGYLRLAFYRSKKGTGGGRVITLCMHHGFTAGRLAGGKALALERWMWQHEADITLLAHCHDTLTKTVATEYVTRSDRLAHRVRVGTYTGSFLRSTIEEASTYSEVKGYPPNAPGCPEIHVWPALKDGPKVGILQQVEL
jgi:hypothetical protein